MLKAAELEAWRADVRRLQRALLALAETTDSAQLALVAELSRRLLDYARLLRRLDRALFGVASHGR